MRGRDRGAGLVLAAVLALSACGGNRPLRVDGGTQKVAVDAAPLAPFKPYQPPAADGSAAGGSGSIGGEAGQAGSLQPAVDASMAAQGGSSGSVDNGTAGDMGGGGAGGEGTPPTFCDGMSKRPLPYAIARDFQSLVVLNAPPSFAVLPGTACDQTDFPDVTTTVDGGADAVDASADGSPPADASGALTVVSCDVFRYTPDDCVAANAGAVDIVAPCWAGVLYMPVLGAFAGPGICIAPGATAIHFKARASRNGARIKWGAIRAGLGTTEFFIPVTTAWRSYSVSIPAEDYDNEVTIPFGGVSSGFSVVVEPQDHPGGTYIFVSDIVWAAN